MLEMEMRVLLTDLKNIPKNAAVRKVRQSQMAKLPGGVRACVFRVFSVGVGRWVGGRIWVRVWAVGSQACV